MECSWVFCIGVEFSLRGRSIPTDGSGRLLITDTSLHNRQSSTSNEEKALICRSSRNVGEIKDVSPGVSSFWYLDPEVKTTANTISGEKISKESDSRGWFRKEGHVHVNGEGSPFHRVVRLNRVSETALEGKFTCYITGDSNNNKSLLILYPSE